MKTDVREAYVFPRVHRGVTQHLDQLAIEHLDTTLNFGSFLWSFDPYLLELLNCDLLTPLSLYQWKCFRNELIKNFQFLLFFESLN